MSTPPSPTLHGCHHAADHTLSSRRSKRTNLSTYSANVFHTFFHFKSSDSEVTTWVHFCIVWHVPRPRPSSLAMHMTPMCTGSVDRSWVRPDIVSNEMSITDSVATYLILALILIRSAMFVVWKAYTNSPLSYLSFPSDGASIAEGTVHNRTANRFRCRCAIWNSARYSWMLWSIEDKSRLPIENIWAGDGWTQLVSPAVHLSASQHDSTESGNSFISGKSWIYSRLSESGSRDVLIDVTVASVSPNPVVIGLGDWSVLFSGSKTNWRGQGQASIRLRDNGQYTVSGDDKHYHWYDLSLSTGKQYNVGHLPWVNPAFDSDSIGSPCGIVFMKASRKHMSWIEIMKGNNISIGG